MMKKKYLIPEMIIRQVNINLMQDGVSLVDNPKPTDPSWGEMESRENGGWDDEDDDDIWAN